MTTKTALNVRKLLEKRLARDRKWTAIQGDGSGTTTIPGHKNQVYVRSPAHDLPVVVYNTETSHREGLHVSIGRGDDGRRVRVISDDADSIKAGDTVKPHVHEHEWGGGDVGYWHLQQVYDLAFTASGMIITFKGGWCHGMDGAYFIPAQSVDMTSHVPVADALYALVSAETDGTLSVKEGANVAFIDLAYSDIPAPDDDTAPLVVVRLYAGQTTLSMTYADPDVKTLAYGPRYFWRPLLDELADVNAPAPADGDALIYDTATGKWINSASVGTFLGLNDTPDSYAGQANLFVRVNALENALEFYDPTTKSTSVYGGVVLLDETAAAGGQASFSASGIAATYSVIKIFLNGKSEAAATSDTAKIALNTDTTDANYRYLRHLASSATHNYGADDGRYVGSIGAATGGSISHGEIEATILDPANTAFYKVVQFVSRLRADATNGYAVFDGMLSWESTAAITAIDLVTVSGADFAEGTRCVIVGYRDIDVGVEIGAFTDLSDVPAAYTGYGGYQVTVKDDESGLEFSDASGYKVHAGFVNRTDSTLSIDTGTGVLTIAPAVTSYDIYVAGVKFTISTNKTVTITDDQTITYVYFDTAGALQKSTSAWDLTSADTTPCAIVFKDGSTYAVTDERHSYERNRNWHRWAHFNIGAIYSSGLTGTFATGSISVVQGVVYDEDIKFDTGGTKTATSLWYRNATTGMRLVRGAAYAKAVSGGGVLQYDDGSGTLQDVTLNRYVTNWVYVSHDDTEPIYTVVGQNNSTTLALARNAAAPTINLSTAEWRLIYRVIYQRTNGTPAGEYVEAADFRTVQTGVPTSAITTDHSALINRDAASSHPAAAVSIADAGSYYTGTEVETALQEIGAGTTLDGRYVERDGTGALTADWDAGSYEIRAQTFESDVATGTAPLVVASTTLVTNLNADQVDGYHITGQPREVLSAARTYYVRTDGNDSNDGLTDSSGGAFLTIQHAVDIVTGLDINGQIVTIQVRDGTYTGAVTLKNVVGYAASGNLVIQGNSGTPANVIISVTSDNCFAATDLVSVWDIKDMKTQTTTSGNCFQVNGSKLRFGNIDFGDAASGSHISVVQGGNVTCISNYAITGDALIHWRVINASLIVQSKTVTLTGTPAFTYFAYSNRIGNIQCDGCTFTGGATGTRYICDWNSLVYTGGGGATYLPGDVNGSPTNGGQYG